MESQWKANGCKFASTRVRQCRSLYLRDVNDANLPFLHQLKELKISTQMNNMCMMYGEDWAEQRGTVAAQLERGVIWTFWRPHHIRFHFYLEPFPGEGEFSFKLSGFNRGLSSLSVMNLSEAASHKHMRSWPANCQLLLECYFTREDRWKSRQRTGASGKCSLQTVAEWTSCTHTHTPSPQLTADAQLLLILLAPVNVSKHK